MFGRSISCLRGGPSSFRMRAIFLTFLTIPHSRGFLVSDAEFNFQFLHFILSFCWRLVLLYGGTVLCTAKDHMVDMN